MLILGGGRDPVFRRLGARALGGTTQPGLSGPYGSRCSRAQEGRPVLGSMHVKHKGKQALGGVTRRWLRGAGFPGHLCLGSRPIVFHFWPHLLVQSGASSGHCNYGEDRAVIGKTQK